MTKITAAVVGILLGIGASVAALLVHESISGETLFLAMPLILPFVFLVAAGQAMLVAAPLLLILQRRIWLNFFTATLTGAFAGAVPWLIVDLLGHGGGFGRYTLPVIHYFAAYGAIGGAVFYLVFKGMSPNNSFKPKPLRGSA